MFLKSVVFHKKFFNFSFTVLYEPRLQDFGDGGAYPEIQVAQYPLGMGFKKSTSNALAMQVDATGKIKYDAIARQGHSQDKVRACTYCTEKDECGTVSYVNTLFVL